MQWFFFFFRNVLFLLWHLYCLLYRDFNKSDFPQTEICATELWSQHISGLSQRKERRSRPLSWRWSVSVTDLFIWGINRSFESECKNGAQLLNPGQKTQSRVYHSILTVFVWCHACERQVVTSRPPAVHPRGARARSLARFHVHSLCVWNDR